MKIITVSREFGSGGREIGKRLADRLGVAYYDKEIISAIADKLKLDENYIENKLEQNFTINYPYTFRRSFSMAYDAPNQTAKLLLEQHKIIRSLAEKEDCVIVGRGADAVLCDKKPFNFLCMQIWRQKLSAVAAERIRMKIYRIMNWNGKSGK